MALARDASVWGKVSDVTKTVGELGDVLLRGLTGGNQRDPGRHRWDRAYRNIVSELLQTSPIIAGQPSAGPKQSQAGRGAYVFQICAEAGLDSFAPILASKAAQLGEQWGV
jgi:hypothetical protein